MSIHDVGNGKEMFELAYRDVFHHDTSVFDRGSASMYACARITLQQIVEGRHPSQQQH